MHHLLDDFIFVIRLSLLFRFLSVPQLAPGHRTVGAAASHAPPPSLTPPLPSYRLLVDCNQLAVDIDNEIIVVYNFLRDRYKTKFPELESLVHNPLEYARVVQVGQQDGGLCVSWFVVCLFVVWVSHRGSVLGEVAQLRDPQAATTCCPT